MNKFLSVLALLFLLSLLAGCAGSPVKEKFDPGLDKMTFDQVLNEMRGTWGEPTRVMEGITRDILELQYSKIEHKTVQETTYHSADFFNEATSESEAVEHIKSMEIYRFSFDKKDRLLRWYSYYSSQPDGEHEDFDSGNNAYQFISGEKVNEISLGKQEVSAQPAQGTTTVKTTDSSGRITSISTVRNGAGSAGADSGTNPLEKRLKELKKLKEQGLITDDEYNSLRKKALSDYK
jgi:hypothetical protein